MARSVLVAAAVAAVFALAAVTALALFRGGHDGPSGVSFQLAHTSLSIRASSFAAAGEPESNANHLRDAAAAAAASSPEEEQALSDHVFHKTKFALHGSHATASSASFSVRSLGAQQGDKQFFVRFSTRCDVRTLVALHKFTGHRVVAHVEGGLYVAIGGEAFAAKARRFPGVAWVQEREALSKVSSSLQQVLKLAGQPSGFAKVKEQFAPDSPSGADGVTEVVAECWYDGCGAAAVAVRSVCRDVYVHPTVVEAHCSAGSLHAAVAVLSEHVAVDHVDVKPVAVASNFGGRAIIGTGPNASNPDASRVLSDIDVSGSLIGVADSGIDMNNCFFYDDAASSPWNNSRVVQSYVVQPCEMCGRCCGSQSGPNCTNALNSCGNFIDQSGHGTHVCGTVAGAGPANVSYGNGVASGAKIFFQDMENFLRNDTCFSKLGCLGGLSVPTDLLNLFTPAFNAGARVHSNSWGASQVRGIYNIQSKAVDAFTSSNPTFLILFAAGNQGLVALTGTTAPPGTCKNCLSVGASQQSDALFRSMQPYVDDGVFCPLVPANRSLVTDPCCTNPLSCVNRCCNWTSPLNMSLACCASQTTCGYSGSCSVKSGNLRSATNMASFSSRGPTLDGRFKPDLVAPGEGILSAATPAQVIPGAFNFTSRNHCVVPSQTQARSYSDSFDKALDVKSGTSMATPLMAGAVEKIRQYFVQGYYPAGSRGTGTPFQPEEALLRAVVLASCVSVLSDAQSWGVWSQRLPTDKEFFRFPIPPAYSPNIFQGFGLPVLDQAVHMANSTNGYSMRFTSGTYSSNSSATAYSYNITCQPAQAIPLTLALVWTDPPGSVNSQKQLVNDLDLIVLLPDSTPSQLFGNMRAFADQINTVERVVTQCPPAGFVTAIVALGDSLKTSSQAWYLVANGPVLNITAAPLPPYSSGRVAGPATQSQPCTFDVRITAAVKFKPSSSWSCVGLTGIWDCSVKRQAFVLSLAQVVGVAVQGVSVISSGSTGISMTLQCSAMINTWQSANLVSLRYVTAMTLLNAILSVCNAASSACEVDPVLGAFDWSTFASVAPPAARISISVTAYNNGNCTNMSSTFGMAPNPFVFTDQGCFPGPIVLTNQLFLKALSCGTNVTFQLSPNDPSCVGNQLENASVIRGACHYENLNVPGLPVSFLYTCNEMPPSASDGTHTCENGKLCLPISDGVFYALVAVLFVHVSQAAAWAVVSKRKRVFSAGSFLVILFVPVVGLVMWLRVCRSSAVPQRHETLLSDIERAPQERE